VGGRPRESWREGGGRATERAKRERRERRRSGGSMLIVGLRGHCVVLDSSGAQKKILAEFNPREYGYRRRRNLSAL